MAAARTRKTPRLDKVNIRTARATDLEAIVDIYNASIPSRRATADTAPVSAESRRVWLLERDATRYPVWVVEQEKRVAGWLALNPFYGRAAYAATTEVSTYVDPAWHRKGIGSALMRYAEGRADQLGFKTFLAFVFAHNEPSVELYRKFGYEAWGHLPRVAVLDGVERDLLILGKRLSERRGSSGQTSSPE